MLHSLKRLIPFSKKISLAVIFLEYDRPNHGGSNNVFATLQRYLDQIQKCRITYLRVDNKNEENGLCKIAPHIYTLGGDNRYREFSGWQKGIKHLNEIPQKFDLILFVNDMFLAPGESFLKDYATQELLAKSIKENSIIGRLDSTGQKYYLYGYDVSQWVCTNCFLVPKKAVDELGSIVSIGDNINDILPESYPNASFPDESPEHFALKLFNKDAPINNTYKLWLVEWLTKRWHSKIEINEKTWNMFQTKIRNILNESLLTARLAKLGYKAAKYGDKFYY